MMMERFSKLFGFQDQAVVEEIKELKITQLIANPFQPRTHFDEQKIDELAISIKNHGLIQPIVVRKSSGSNYEIVAGERRWRAAIKIGLQSVPVIVKILTDEETATIALIENLQREELTAIEEANAYQQLILLQSLTQEALAEQLGKSQSSIANKLRLLQLCDEVKDALFRRKISERHARSLLKIVDREQQIKLMKDVVDKDLSVKQLDTKIKYLLEENKISMGRRISYSKDVRLALNTVRQAVEMSNNSGINTVAEETDHEDFIEINIKIFKRK
jgi:ParB family chromosome partitioning protein